MSTDLLDTVLARFADPHPEAEGQYMARCPVHDDATRSLSVGQGDKGVVVKCLAGCETRTVLEAVGLTFRDLFPPETRQRGKGHVAATYPYHDAEGALLFEVVRLEPKAFRQRRPDGAGGWVWSLKGVRRELYRLPQVLEAVRERRRVYVAEGEKDADRLAALGLVATTAPGGADKWARHYTEALAGAADVVVLPDNDEAGAKHAAKVCAELDGKADLVRVLELPGLPPKGDVSDWLAKGGTAEALELLADEARPWGVRAKADPKADKQIRGPLDAWEVLDGNLVQWRGSGANAAPHSMFRGTVEIARSRTLYTEDPDREGEWIEEEEITYRFRLRSGRVLERTVAGGREPFLDLLKFSALDEATDAMRSDERQRLHKWALERSPGAVRTGEVRAVGPHGDKGWLAPPGVRVRAGEVGTIKGVTVGPPGASAEFRRFRLDQIDAATFKRAARWIVDHLLACDHVGQAYTLPLLGAFQSAPLWHYLEPLRSWQRYVFFVQGPSGVGKSQVCRYFWSFWGAFVDAQGLTTWLSTSTYLEDLLHQAVGVPVFVSDWKRANFGPDAYRSAMSLIQAYADRSSRGRASRGTSKAERKKPPRCTWVIDGEDLPEGEQSTLGRLIVLEVEPRGETERCASASRATLDPAMVELLPGVTAQWIAWVQRHADRLADELLRAEEHLAGLVAHERGSTNRSRLVRAYAVQDLTVRAFLQFLDETAGLGGLHHLADRALEVHVAMADAQLGRVVGESAGEQFLAGLGALLQSGAVEVIKAHAHTGEIPFGEALNNAPRVGTYHGGNLTVWPDVVLPLVQQHLSRGGGRRIEFSSAAIRQQLEAQGALTPSRRRTPGHPDGKSRARTWTIPAALVGGEFDEGMFE